MGNVLSSLGVKPPAQSVVLKPGSTASKEIMLRTIPEDAYPGLDPEWRAMWNAHGSHIIRSDEVTLDEYRKDPAKYNFAYATCTGPDVHKVEDISIPVSSPAGEIQIRIYTPEGPGPFPVHLNFHGGGWVVGSLESERAWCRHMCNKVGIKVVDVAYRKGPEFPFPTAIYDCWDAVKWVRENSTTIHVDPESVSFGGLSAGGHMSAVLAHFARDEGVPIKLHLMIVPATDMRYCHRRTTRLNEMNCPYASARDLQDLPWSPLGREQWFLKYWLGDDDELQDRAFDSWIMTPMLAENFRNLPPAHVVTAEFDLERDEGEAYAEKMRDAGNKVTTKRYKGVPHAFAHFNHPERGLAKSFEFVEDTSQLLREAHFT
ncbi:Alpha/beta hydrolase fold-3 [Apiospora kogelbergensis]|uniref:Alpha/beta hydrolase fold-3 n=1 Tax=Apiospora kogelbergensis TaxID=1337665 RepID=UPI00312F4A33